MLFQHWGRCSAFPSCYGFFFSTDYLAKLNASRPIVRYRVNCAPGKPWLRMVQLQSEPQTFVLRKLLESRLSSIGLGSGTWLWLGKFVSQPWFRLRARKAGCGTKERRGMFESAGTSRALWHHLNPPRLSGKSDCGFISTFQILWKVLLLPTPYWKKTGRDSGKHCCSLTKAAGPRLPCPLQRQHDHLTIHRAY